MRRAWVCPRQLLCSGAELWQSGFSACWAQSHSCGLGVAHGGSMMEEKPAEVNTGRRGEQAWVRPSPGSWACQGQGRAGSGSAQLPGPLSSYSASQGKEAQTSPSDREVLCLKGLSDWNVTGPGCVMALWTAARLAACLTGRGLAHGVKHTLSFISEEIQCPAVKQQAFPKTAFCNTAGTKHQYFFQRVSFTETLQTQPPPQARQVQPG